MKFKLLLSLLGCAVASGAVTSLHDGLNHTYSGREYTDIDELITSVTVYLPDSSIVDSTWSHLGYDIVFEKDSITWDNVRRYNNTRSWEFGFSTYEEQKLGTGFIELRARDQVYKQKITVPVPEPSGVIFSLTSLAFLLGFTRTRQTV